jgi:hypothetical protein
MAPQRHEDAKAGAAHRGTWFGRPYVREALGAGAQIAAQELLQPHLHARRSACAKSAWRGTRAAAAQLRGEGAQAW